MSERDLATAVRAVLLSMGCWTKDLGADRRGRDRHRQPLGKGAPDIFVLDRGIAIALETKASHRATCGCRSCADQREWARGWREAGGAYAIVRTVEDAMRAIQVMRVTGHALTNEDALRDGR